jgi:mono/diheme cytochrome c family protein
MRSRVLQSAAVMAGIVLTLALGIFFVLNGWSAESTKGSGREDHQMMIGHEGPAIQKGSHQATPRGWRFVLPTGNADAGRKAFADFECFKCHAVQGEQFPAPKADQGGVGPALSGMGPMHPAEYFAEAIIHPNASAAWRIKHHQEEEKGYLGADGKSKMPGYNGAMTVQQLIDLVAYLKTLTSPAGRKH